MFAVQEKQCRRAAQAKSKHRRLMTQWKWPCCTAITPLLSEAISSKKGTSRTSHGLIALGLLWVAISKCSMVKWLWCICSCSLQTHWRLTKHLGRMLVILPCAIKGLHSSCLPDLRRAFLCAHRCLPSQASILLGWNSEVWYLQVKFTHACSALVLSKHVYPTWLPPSFIWRSASSLLRSSTRKSFSSVSSAPAHQHCAPQ